MELHIVEKLKKTYRYIVLLWLNLLKPCALCAFHLTHITLSICLIWIKMFAKIKNIQIVI